MTETALFRWYLICTAEDIPLNEGRRVYMEEKEVALFHLTNGFRAVDNQCPHKQGPLADGIVAGNSVFCPLHTLKMDLNSGCAINGEGQVKTYPVKVVDDKVYIAFAEGALQPLEAV